MRPGIIPVICSALCLVLALTANGADAQVGAGIDPVKARGAFAEAQRLSEKDAGDLWGKVLYGPMMFVAPATREIVANQPDAHGILHPQDRVYMGVLPADVIIANTAITWSGKRWTMVMWPLPESSQPRNRLLAHELFHHIEPALDIPLASPENPQLDTPNGRLWLQLEWRALAAAMVESGAAQTQAIRDALAFRVYRQQLFAGSVESERALELNEGLAEYTGLSVSAPDTASARWYVAARLTDPRAETFVRSFAYTSGPAYGLLLDERAPGWRSRIREHSDLGMLLASVVHGATVGAIAPLACRYGEVALRIIETERAATADAEKAQYTKLLVDGPTLTLPSAGNFNYGFNPNELVSLPGVGTVYPSMQAQDTWGTLDVKQGALVTTGLKSVRVTAPPDIHGEVLNGSGWTLNLVPGWHVVAEAGKPGSYILQKP